MPNVSIVVPTFNEGGNVGELVRRLGDSFAGQDVEILFVDDSTDDTPQIIEITARHSHLLVRVLHREGAGRHGGLAGAVTDGIRCSASNYIVVMDGDLQHPPELAPLLHDLALGHGADLVVASRYCDQGRAVGLGSRYRRSVSGGSTLLARRLFPRRVGAKCTDPMTGFFCLRRESVDLDRLRPRGFKILLELLASHDLRVRELPFIFGERHAGQSKASWRHGLQFLRQLVVLRITQAWPNVAARPAGSARPTGPNPQVQQLQPDLQVESAVVPRFPQPPTDQEKYAYLDGRQHRWVFWFAALAFLGVAFSLAGLALQSAWTAVFFLPLLVLAVEQILSLRTSTYGRRIGSLDHQTKVDMWCPARYPSVDVFLPVRGEDVGLLANTAEHVGRLRWPGELTVYLLDDAADPAVRDLAAAHGFSYLARGTDEFKKAGNLQHGYRHSCGEHIAIFDADFVPRPDFLHDLVPYLDDPAVGIVQSPQYFATDPAMSWLERAAGATQELFFRLIQPSRDAVGAAICVGTSAIYRRAALQAIGGFPQIGHSEDVFTGVRMARMGFRLQYVPVLVSRGACPSDLDAFIGQQYRWCEGSMALVADPQFHEEQSMSLHQRLSFWSGFLYYLTTAMNAVLAPLPLLVMLFFYPRNISALNMLPLLGVIVLWLWVLPAVSHGHWRVEVLRAQTIYGFAHLFCILDMFHGRVSEWVPTGVGQSTSRDVAQRVHSFLGPYLAVSQLLVLAGLVKGVIDYGLASFWANILLALFGAYIFVPVAWSSLAAARRRPQATVIDLDAWADSDARTGADRASGRTVSAANRNVLEAEAS